MNRYENGGDELCKLNEEDKYRENDEEKSTVKYHDNMQMMTTNDNERH